MGGLVILFLYFPVFLPKTLAKKMTVLYKLARGQLSKQHHYDFGLRALKSVLVMAGELKRGSPELKEVGAPRVRPGAGRDGLTGTVQFSTGSFSLSCHSSWLSGLNLVCFLLI